jgi:hypothetical protein
MVKEPWTIGGGAAQASIEEISECNAADRKHIECSRCQPIRAPFDHFGPVFKDSILPGLVSGITGQVWDQASQHEGSSNGARVIEGFHKNGCEKKMEFLSVFKQPKGRLLIGCWTFWIRCQLVSAPWWKS